MIKPHFILWVLVAFFSSACQRTDGTADYNKDLTAQAFRIAQSSIIVDTHIDVPMKLLAGPGDVSVAAEGFDFDHPRAIIGGLNAPFMSIYTSAKLESEGRSKEVADELIDIVEKMARDAPDKFAIATSPADIRSQFASGLMSLPMGMENGSPIEGDLANLKYFYDRGIRYITLTHSENNHLSDSSFDDEKKWHGLSAFGVDVVREMNRLGIMVDVSHLTDAAFWDVLRTTRTPVIASHSSARHFTPGFERNMSDAMIEALADNGGVIQINFGSGFITSTAHAFDAAGFAAARRWQAQEPGRSLADAVTEFLPQYLAEHGPYPFAALDDVLDHFDHVVALAGVEHVGIGSDFDGVRDTLPSGLKDVSAYPTLVEGLLRRGYSEADIRKILGENLLRVWSDVEAFAALAARVSGDTSAENAMKPRSTGGLPSADRDGK